MATTLESYGWQSALWKDGQVLVTDAAHRECWWLYATEILDLPVSFDDPEALWEVQDANPDVVEGFTDSEGVFHTRQEAMKRWRREYAFRYAYDRSTRDWGDSEDMFTAARLKSLASRRRSVNVRP